MYACYCHYCLKWTYQTFVIIIKHVKVTKGDMGLYAISTKN
jgi:hypothetical protein